MRDKWYTALFSTLSFSLVCVSEFYCRCVRCKRWTHRLVEPFIAEPHTLVHTDSYQSHFPPQKNFSFSSVLSSFTCDSYFAYGSNREKKQTWHLYIFYLSSLDELNWEMCFVRMRIAWIWIAEELDVYSNRNNNNSYDYNACKFIQSKYYKFCWSVFLSSIAPFWDAWKRFEFSFTVFFCLVHKNDLWIVY